jgi:hypothetical protein
MSKQLAEALTSRAYFLATRAEAGKDIADPRTVELLREAATFISNTPAWVPVSEREPEATGRYLAYHGTARWIRDVHFYRPRPGYTGPAAETSWGIDPGAYPLLGITHWMPLPGPPAFQPQHNNTTKGTTVITPTIGRVVWYYHGHHTQDQAYAALVTYVHSDTLINCVAFNPNGEPLSCTSVPLIQDNSERPVGHYAEWMPYQKGQAAKTEALEKQVAGA